MDSKQIDVMVADASHEVYVDKILDTIREAAKVRGTGIAERTHEYVATKMKEGKAIIALCGDDFDTKPHEYLANIFHLSFLCHCTDQKADGKEQSDIICQLERNELSRNGCPNIGPHDNPKGLLQVHETCVDKPHGHDRCCARRL